jgi:acyl transferase domain-containing protein
MSERRNLLEESLAAIERLQARLDASERARREPIAIVGAGCRYPGGVETPEDLWRLLRGGVNAVSEIPADRWDVDAYYDPDPKAPGKMITRRAGFLDRVDGFDAQFFGISPREAATMDPQQRLLLETATEALESAALATDRLAGSATGVFVGITTSDYGQLLRVGGPETSDVYSATGAALNAAAGRISFTYGFQGPCVALDTACSSSLVAVHLACQSLRAGESDLALAGGVNVVLSPDAMVLFSKWGMMAPDGACKTFDAAADGFVRAEGCAMIALKRLADAQAAGDPILAVIRGSAVNSDGRSSGLTVPNGPAQQAVVRKALADAGVTPGDIDYVEAHGTGTPLGDPIEIEALGAVMGAARGADRPLLVGSIKTNLGHTEAASGLAGLLKVVMSLRHDCIPPHLHFSTPNPRIPWANLPMRVPIEAVAWPPGERVRRAGVSSFGFSGTNAHVIVEEAPVPAPGAAERRPRLIVLSARGEAALRQTAVRQADYLGSQPESSLADVATTLSAGRAHFERRAALVAESVDEASAALREFGGGGMPAGMVAGSTRLGERPKIAFLFTGQGSQYAGMGRELYDSEPVFRASLDRCASILADHLERPLLEVLFPAKAADTPIGETAYTQPALFALEYSLCELWRSWGITPSIVAGHSVGEYVAACVAGVFTLEDGLALIAARGALMQALPPGGAMAAVFADEQRVAVRISGYGARVAIAAINGPEETVISGDADAVAEIVTRCTA